MQGSPARQGSAWPVPPFGPFPICPCSPGYSLSRRSIKPERVSPEISFATGASRPFFRSQPSAPDLNGHSQRDGSVTRDVGPGRMMASAGHWHKHVGRRTAAAPAPPPPITSIELLALFQSVGTTHVVPESATTLPRTKGSKDNQNDEWFRHRSGRTQALVGEKSRARAPKVKPAYSEKMDVANVAETELVPMLIFCVPAEFP